MTSKTQWQWEREEQVFEAEEAYRAALPPCDRANFVTEEIDDSDVFGFWDPEMAEACGAPEQSMVDHEPLPYPDEDEMVEMAKAYNKE